MKREMIKNWMMLLIITTIAMWSNPVKAQCPPATPNQDVEVRFANESIECNGNTLQVEVQLSNPTGFDYSVSGLSLRFSFNNAMIDNPVISMQSWAGTHTLINQSGIWSYGMVEFSSANTLSLSGAWTTVGTLTFDIISFNEGSARNCISLEWNTAADFPPTTGQEFLTLSCQPDLNYISYGNNYACLSDSCPNPPLDIFASVTDVSCNGSGDGSIDLTVNGGTSPYTYNWSTGDTTEDISGLSQGNYSVTVYDATGDSITNTSIVVSQFTGLSVSISTTDAICNQSGTGSVTTSVAGGNTPYTYAWSNSETSADLAGIKAGTYTVTVTDVNGCTGTAQGSVGEPDELIYNVTIQNVSCTGGSDGSLDFSLTGGTPPYQYLWRDPFSGDTLGQNEDLTGIPAGIYQIDVIDANGCTGRVFYLISEPTPVVITGNSVTNASCYGESDGAIDISTSGGTGVITYLWSNGETSQDLDNEPAGIYTVTVTDLNGCTETDSYTITQPDSIDIFLGEVGIVDATCNGFSTGSIDIQVTGGIPPYTYTWSTGDSTQDISGLPAGSYSVTVTDATGCTNSAENYIVGEPDVLTVTLTLSQITCSSADDYNDGSISTTVNGGTAPYFYIWSSGAITSSIDSLTEDLYSVTVTDAKGCTATASDSITIPFCNTPPLARNDFNNTLINMPVSGDVSTNDIDFDGDDLLVNTVLLTDPTNGSVVINPDGSYIYTPDSGFTGFDAFQYITCDNGIPVECDTAWVGIVVYPPKDPRSGSGGGGNVNRPPVANYDHFITYKDLPVLGTVITNDWDPDSTDILTVTSTPLAIRGPFHGSVAINSDGTFIYVPDSGYLGNDLFVYEICDNGNPVLCDTTLVAITMIDGFDPDNNPPFAVDDAVVTYYNQSVNGSMLPNDYDFDGDSIAVVLAPITGPSNGTLSVNSDGTFTYTPDSNYIGPDEFTYLLCDNGTPFKCDTATVHILVLPIIPCGNTIASDVSCNGDSDGAIDLTVTCGVEPFTFLWSNGDTTEDISGLTAGIYTVTITGAFGNTLELTDTVNQPDQLIADMAWNNVSCNGGSDGSIDISPSGGTTPYTFIWSTGDTTEDISGLSAGIYTVTITDANGCSITPSQLITEPTDLTLTGTPSDALCYGNADGSIDITAAGGTPAYTYSWSNGDATEDINGLIAGTYTVTVTDAKGCTESDSFTINQPDSLSIQVIELNDVTCFGFQNGNIGIFVAGGTPAYTYTWSDGSTTQDITNLGPGTYVLTVTDANGCFKISDSIDILEPLVLTLSGVVTDALCNGDSNGSIDITVGGGTPPYNFNWDNGSTLEDLINQAAGRDSVTVSDANGCVITGVFTVGEPDELIASVTSTTDASCNGNNDGAIDLSVTGGTPAYTYAWSNGDTTQDISGLTTGTYDVTVTDANGCVDTLSGIVINQPDSLQITLTNVNVSCNGTDDGSISSAVIGGTTPYTYIWSTGGTSSSINGLAPGIYTVTVTDAQSCSATLSDTITQPDELQLSIITTNVNCLNGIGGSVDLSVVGGTAPYTYVWSNGAATQDISNLFAGIYFAYVTDANGCLANITASIATDNVLIVNLGITNASCGDSNGVATATISGGAAPYTYAWSNGETTSTIDSLAPGVYGVTVIDANGCSGNASAPVSNIGFMTLSASTISASCNLSNGSINLTITGAFGNVDVLWSRGDITEDISNVAQGVYTVTVTDANGCQESLVVTVGETLGFQLDAQASAANCSQNDGSATVIALGATPPVTFLWSNGDTTSTISGVPAGTYSVSAIDSNGCMAFTYININNNNSQLLATVFSTNITCNTGNDGSAWVTVTGVSSYTVLWSNGATTDTITSLAAGTYVVEVTDTNGCKVIESISIISPDPILITADKFDLNCNGDGSGSIDLTVSGGLTPYTFAWGGGQTSQNISGLNAGNYSVTVTDANSCSANTIITVAEPDVLEATAITVTNVSCNGLNDGSIDIEVTGGTPNYFYSWNNGASTNQDTSGLAAGTYILIVGDLHECFDSIVITITEPDSLTVNLAGSTIISCNSVCDGAIDIDVAGGTLPYTYLWSNGAISQDLNNLCEGTYSVTVTDSLGCENSQFTFVLTQPDPIVAIPNITNITCYGDEDGSIKLSLGGGTPPFIINWSTGATGDSIGGLAPGTYTATLVDANGCTDTIQATVPGLDPIDISTTIVTDASCDTLSDGQIIVNVTGGTGPYEIKAFFLNGVPITNTGSNIFPNLFVGDYVIIIIDANGCTIPNDTFTVSGPYCNQPPIAIPDTAWTYENKPVDIPVLDNDYDQDDTAVVIFVTGVTTPPANGDTEVNADGTITYTPNEGFIGIDSFTYQISDGIATAEAVVIVYVLPDRPNIFIPNGFTPNGDGFNDYFEITDIDKFPNNDLIIFNRWGNKVWKAYSYNNEWRGTSMDGDDVPDGTYYYILNLGDETGTQYAGYIVVHR